MHFSWEKFCPDSGGTNSWYLLGKHYNSGRKELVLLHDHQTGKARGGRCKFPLLGALVCRLMLAIVLLNMHFIILRYIPCIPSFFSTFIMEGCWILSKAFTASIEISKWFLSLILVLYCITFIDFHMLNLSWITGMKPMWSWWCFFLLCRWVVLASIMLRIFASVFIRDIAV
jgi:hypothetical protein